MKKEFQVKSGVRSKDFAKPGFQKHTVAQSNLEGSDLNASFRPANYYCIAIGELVRKSKTRTSWHFDLDGVRYCFDLEHSVVTGSKKLLRNNCLIHTEKSLRKSFQYELMIGAHRLWFSQHGEKFELFINNESFMYVYNRMKQNDHFIYESRSKEIKERNKQDIMRQQEERRKSNYTYDNDGGGDGGGKSGNSMSFWDNKQGDGSKGSSDNTQDTGYGGYKKEDQARKRSTMPTNQFDFDFNFNGSGGGNNDDQSNQWDKPRDGKRYDDDDDEDDQPPRRGDNNTSTFDFDNYDGDKGDTNARGEGSYGRDGGGDHSYGGDTSKFDFEKYDSYHGGGGGSSYSEPSYPSSSNRNYDKNITAIGSSGEMVGPHGYVQGSRRIEDTSVQKKIFKTAAAVGSVVAEKVPEAISYIKEEIAPSSGPSLPNQAQYNDPYGNNASRIERQRKDQIEGKNNEEEEEYNEDNAWGDVRKAKADVIDTGVRRDYGSPGRGDGGYADDGIRRDAYNRDENRYNYDSHGDNNRNRYDGDTDYRYGGGHSVGGGYGDHRYGGDRDRDRYGGDQHYGGGDRERESRQYDGPRDNYGRDDRGTTNDFGFGGGNDRERDNGPKQNQNDGSNAFFDFDMGAPTQGNNNDRKSRSRSPNRSYDQGQQNNNRFVPPKGENPMGNIDYFKNQEYWRQKREAASKAISQSKRPYEVRSAYQIENEYHQEWQHRKFNKDSKLPPQASGAKFQRANTYQQRNGGYDTYGKDDKSDEEEEDYRRYMDAQKREDPWQRSGSQRERAHSIGSDFDNDGKAKEEKQKEPEQTDFFGLETQQKEVQKPAAAATGGFDFDFGLSAPAQNITSNKPVQSQSAAFDFDMPSSSKTQQNNDLLGTAQTNTQASKSAVTGVGAMVFDFETADNTVEDPKHQSLLDIAQAPQGEFDFDFTAPTSQASVPFNNNNNGGEIDLLNEPMPQKSMDDLMNSKTDNQIKQEQEKTDKIQDFLNKQFSEITLKQQERQNNLKQGSSTFVGAPSSNGSGMQNLFGNSQF